VVQLVETPEVLQVDRDFRTVVGWALGKAAGFVETVSLVHETVGVQPDDPGAEFLVGAFRQPVQQL
jgi:hypothetical protein